MSPMAVLVVLAAFTRPEQIETSPAMMLWVLPLAASIAIVYKATKLPRIAARSFIKESAVLFGSIVVFVFVSMIIGFVLTWLIVE